MGNQFFLWNVWSDFFLDRWRRSGVIRMSAAAARALNALKSDNALLLTVIFHLHEERTCGGIDLIIIENSTWRFSW